MTMQDHRREPRATLMQAAHRSAAVIAAREHPLERAAPN